jgi:hypothetical protein
MATRLAIPSRETELKLVGTYDSYLTSRVQRIGFNADIPTTAVYEVGNILQAGLVQDTPAITLTFSLFDVGIKAFSVLTGTNPLAFPPTGVNISSLGECDAIIYIKDQTLTDYVKTGHARRLQISQFAYSYSVGGESTEDYTMTGSEKRWFKNDVVVDRFTTGGVTPTGGLSQAPIVLKNGNYALSVIVDGVYFTETSSAPGVGQYRLNGASNKTLTLGTALVSTCIVVYHANPVGSNWAYVNDATDPAAIRGKDVDVYIALSGVSRVQSVTINGNMNVATVKEMGNRNTVGYQRQTPTVNGTIAVLDTDTDLIDLLLNGSPSVDTEFELGTTCPTTGVPLKIELVDPCDMTVSYTVLKTVYVPKIIAVGDAWAATVNQNATWNINWQSIDAQVTIYSGSM